MVIFALSTIAAINGRAPIWVTIPVNAAVSFVMFTVVHEAVHHSISRKPWVNALLGRLAWILVSPTFCFSSFAFVHLAHHRYANDPADDPDAFANHARFWQLPIRWALSDLFYVAYYRPRLRSRPARELTEAAAMFTLSMAVVAAAAVTGNLWTLAVVIAIPQRVGMTFLAWWFDWLPHHGLNDTPATNRYRTSRVRVGMEWLLTPLMLSQNYHVVHHLHPRVPWYRYLPTWRENEKAYLECDVPISTVFGRPLSPHEFRERKRLNHKRGQRLPLRMPADRLSRTPRPIDSRPRPSAQPSHPAESGCDAAAPGAANDAFDVVVVGSGPAGCSAAILLGRRGLRVALLEAHRNENHYKRLCTHSIRSSALPTLRRLGLDEVLERRGAVRSHDHAWTRHGWVRQTPAAEGSGHGYNVSRRLLDPLLRATAAGISGVELMLGARVTELTFDQDGRVNGVVADIDGSVRRISARLVVGADGHSSKVARLASLPGKLWRNDRFIYFAKYRNVDLPAGCTTALWLLEPDVAYVFRNDEGVTLLAAMPAKDRLPAFQQNRDAAIVKFCTDLPGGPDLMAAQRVSEVIGTTDYPSITRKRIVTRGVALIGDAAMVGDPLWGTGCGWALQSAEWLCDAVAERLLSGTPGSIDAAARRYQSRHRRSLLLHQFMNIDFSRKRRLNFVQRLLYAGAARDPKVADRLLAVGSRNRSPAVLASPPLLIRAAIAQLRPESVPTPRVVERSEAAAAAQVGPILRRAL
ncbi:MAG TPA: fatty acid desaturase [Mycobacterium sp.]|nr:fatty acid desaturase [Mycobacterium sp.]